VADRALVQPYGQICVDGSVINFDETLLPDRLRTTPETAVDDHRCSTLALTASRAAATQKRDRRRRLLRFPIPSDFAGPGLVEFSIAIPGGSGWEPITPDRFTVDLKLSGDHCQVIRFKLRRPVVRWTY
jgi:hypothetical protein